MQYKLLIEQRRDLVSFITTMTPVDSETDLPGITDRSITGYHNPAVSDLKDEDEIDKTPRFSARELVDRARKAFNSGKTRNLKFRRQQLKALLKFLLERKEEIMQAVYKDLRKHHLEVQVLELDGLEAECTHHIADLSKWASPDRPEKKLINLLDGVYVHKEPYGVVLIIGCWNYPMLLSVQPFISAMAAGNCVILKTAELAPSVGQLLIDYLPKYLDQDAYQICCGGPEMGSMLLKEKFDYIFVTGSERVGKIVQHAAAEHLTPTTLELGGNNPVYLDESVDLRRAARRILWGKLINSGQTCVAPDYILCTKNVEQEFLKSSKEVLKEFFGDEMLPPECMSRIINEFHYKRLASIIENGKVAVGGECFFKELVIKPTILIDVDPKDVVLQQIIFGPIICICTVNSVKDAINLINSRSKPLVLYIFSTIRKTQQLLIDNTSSGSVLVNDTVMHIPVENIPFGGVGNSGMGNYHGMYGFNTFTHRRGVLKKDINFLSEIMMKPRYPPYSEFNMKLCSFALRKRPGIPISWLRKTFSFLIGMAVVYFYDKYFAAE